MKRQMRLAFFLAVAFLAAAIAAACGGGGGGETVPRDVEVDVENFGSAAGYWEGSGKASETPWDDPVRKLSRSADFEFWFSIDEDGVAYGEITMTYDALLTVDGLPSFSVPGPGGISVGFAPEVGGKLTDDDPIRKFPIVGVYNEEEETLIFAMVGWDEAEKLEFTLQADPHVSGGLPLDLSSAGGGDGGSEDGDVPGDPGTNEGDVGSEDGDDGGGNGSSVNVSDPGFVQLTYVIDMTPFTPFAASDEGKVEKRPNGPYEVNFELSEDTWAIEWSAVQETSETQTVEIDPAMRQALQDLADEIE